jgi:hypothetical protein
MSRPRPKPKRNVEPSLSDDPRDKLAAALSWSHALNKKSAEYAKVPIYFDLCLEWHEGLSANNQETCRTLADVIDSAHKVTAESIAASLPPAPRCPL